MLAMSKMVTRLFRQGLLLHGRYTFAENKFSNSSAYRVYESTSWKDFIKIIREDGQQISPETLASTSKHIINITNRDKQIDSTDISEVVKVISNVDVESLEPKSVVSLLALIRTFNNRGYNIPKKGTFRQKLIIRFNQFLKDKQIDDISTLIFGYFEMIYSRHYPSIHLATQMLGAEISKDQTNDSIFTVPQIRFLMHCLREKKDLTQSELKIRSHLFFCIISKLETLNLKDVVSIFVDIGHMNTVDMDGKDFSTIKTIGSFIIERINDLQEKSIFDLIRGDHYTPHPIYHKISKELISSIFNEVAEDGSTQISHESLFKITSFVSCRLRFQEFSEEQKKKYYNFIKKYVNEQVSQQPAHLQERFFSSFAQLIKNGYWELSRNEEILDLLSNIQKTPSLLLMEVLVARKLNISSYLNALAELPLENLQKARLLKVAIMLQNMSKLPVYQSYKQKIEMFSHSVSIEVAKCFSSVEKFNHFMREYKFKEKDFPDMKSIDRVCKEFFNDLPNPFQDEPNQFYTNNYLFYLLTNRPNKEVIEFYNANQPAFDTTVLNTFINHHLGEALNIVPLPGLITIIHFKLESLLEQKEEVHLHKIIDLLWKYSHPVIINNLRTGNIFKLLHRLLDNYQTLNSLNANGRFERTLVRYLNLHNRNYSVEYGYRGFLNHCLGKLSAISNQATIQAILENSLRLGLLTEKIVKEEVKEFNFPFHLSSYLKYHHDNTFTPIIEKINATSLLLYCTNKNLGSEMLQNKSTFLTLTSQMKAKELCTCIVNWNLPYQGEYSSFFTALLERLTDTKGGFESSNLVGVIDHLLKNNVFHLWQCKALAEKIVDMAKHKISMFSLETHGKFLQFISTQPAVQYKDYVTYLIKYTRLNSLPAEYNDLLINLSLVYYQFTSEDLKHLPQIIKQRTFDGLRIFLSHEEKCDQELKKRIFAQLKESVSKSTYFLNGLNLNYLKRHYPQETQQWQFTEDQLSHPFVTIKCKPFNLELLKTIAKEKGFKEELEVSLPDNNFGYLLGDCLTIFLTQRHNGAFFEHNYIKKAMKEYLVEQGVKVTDVIAIGRATTPSNMVQYLNKTLPNLVPQELMKKLEATLKSFRNKKPKETTEEE